MVTELSSFIFDGHEKMMDGLFYVLHHDGEVFHFTETIHATDRLTTEQREKFVNLRCLLLMLGKVTENFVLVNIMIKFFTSKQADF